MTTKQKVIVTIAFLALANNITAVIVGLLALDDNPAPVWWLIWLFASFVVAIAMWITLEIIPKPGEED